MKCSPDPHQGDVANPQEEPKSAGSEEREIDQILADSFPASDAPPWTLGVAKRPPKEVRKRNASKG